MTETTDQDIEAAARLVIEEHGDGAGAYAVDRAAELERKGVHAGALRWMKILDAIHRLQARHPAPTRH